MAEIYLNEKGEAITPQTGATAPSYTNPGSSIYSQFSRLSPINAGALGITPINDPSLGFGSWQQNPMMGSSPIFVPQAGVGSPAVPTQQYSSPAMPGGATPPSVITRPPLKLTAPENTDMKADGLSEAPVSVNGTGAATPNVDTEALRRQTESYTTPLMKSLQEQELAKQREIEMAKQTASGTPNMPTSPNTYDEIKRMEEEQQLAEKQRQIDDYMTQAGVIQGRMSQLEAERDMQTSNIELRGGDSMYGITARQAAVEKLYASKIAAEAANLIPIQMNVDILQGKIENANAKIEQYIEAKTNDWKMKYDREVDFRNNNQEILKDLGKEYTDIIDKQIAESQRVYEEKKAEARDIIDLQLDAMTNYGISLDLTGLSFDDAVSAYQRAVLPAARAKQTNSTGTKYETAVRNAIDDLYAGKYGTYGAREKLIASLKGQFPTVDVAKDIYGDEARGIAGRVPNDYETNIVPGTQGQISQWEAESAAWEWLGSAEAQGLTSEQKAAQLMAQGFNPEDFGWALNQ